MQSFRSIPGEVTVWNPEDIESLGEMLSSDKPIPPLSGKPKELDREDILTILSFEYPEVFKDIQKRIRQQEQEITDFEMYAKLITDHNYNLHRKALNLIKGIEDMPL